MKSAKELILKYMKDNDIKNAWLARKMHTEPQYLWKRLKRQDITSQLITQISKALNHNFYADMSRAYEAEAKGVVPIEDLFNEPEIKYSAMETMLKKVVREEIKKQSSGRN